MCRSRCLVAEGGTDGTRRPRDVQSALPDYFSLPEAVIARVNGYAIGGGHHFAYFCDFTIAAEHAVFGQSEPRVAYPASGPTVSYLTRIIGHKGIVPIDVELRV
ncbi:MAG: hypothetical protein GEV05_23780 [Betaproteobacteria bacterium]|nr:hypothetical protein [Betaproteobacteria bacterium]